MRVLSLERERSGVAEQEAVEEEVSMTDEYA